MDITNAKYFLSHNTRANILGGTLALGDYEFAWADDTHELVVQLAGTHHWYPAGGSGITSVGATTPTTLTGILSGDGATVDVVTIGTGLTYDTATRTLDCTVPPPPAAYTDEQAQDAVGAMAVDTATIDVTYTDATPELKWDVKADSIGASLMHATATDVLFGRSAAGAGAGQEVVCTAAGRAVLDDADAAAQRVTLGLGTAATLDADTDGTLAANSDARLATQKAVKTFVSNAVTGLLELKGSTDCSTNPNYPAASKGDAYVVSVAGKVGGAAGLAVSPGDVYLATADNAGGTQAAVGASWDVLQYNLEGVLLAVNNLSDLTSAATARTNLGLGDAATHSAGDFQPYSGTLTVIATDCGTISAGKMILFTGAASATLLSTTAFGQAWLNLADAAAGRTNLGLGTVATQNANAVAITGGTAKFDNTGLASTAPTSAHKFTLKPGNSQTADRTLTLGTADADRTLSLPADATVSGTNTGDQTADGTTLLLSAGQFSLNLAHANTWTASQTIATTTNNTTGLTISSVDTTGRGAEIKLTHNNGTTTLHKWIRSTSGVLQVINSAYTAVLLSVTDSGDVGVTGNVSAANLSGTNTGDQTITLTGDVTGSGTGSFAATITANAVTNAMLRDSAACSVIGRSANSAGDPADIALADGQFLGRRSGVVGGYSPKPSEVTHVGCQAYYDSALTVGTDLDIPNNAFTSVTLKSEAYDTDAFHDTATNPSRMTVPTGLGGYYLLTGMVQFPANATGTRSLRFVKNGVTVLGITNITSVTANAQELSLACVASLAAGDYVEMQAFQNSTATRTLDRVNAYLPQFTVALLGK